MRYSSIYRDQRQQQVRDWGLNAFGDSFLNRAGRARRVVEEAVELAQATGVDKLDILRVVDHVYSRPVGEVNQEVGGVAVTLLAYCSVIGASADALERREIDRILNKDVEHFRKRDAEKRAERI
jgi:NTP pyrophosphatase (non-canonical NTP hydrolase)